MVWVDIPLISILQEPRGFISSEALSVGQVAMRVGASLGSLLGGFLRHGLIWNRLGF